MVTSLIRGEIFQPGTAVGKILACDSGWYRLVLVQRETLCKLSAYHTKNGKIQKLYYHKVLEAKIVLSEHVIISLETEFIENEDEKVSKQDCEINAAKCLMKRLKEEYPRFPVCIQGDALYAAEAIM